MFKLICKQNPRALGIQDEAGAWDLDAFEKHLKQCRTCGRAKRGLKAQLKPLFAHGGKRPGAGRPPLDKVNRKRVNITISDREHQRARWLGEGNVSLGIARALLTYPDWARKVE